MNPILPIIIFCVSLSVQSSFIDNNTVWKDRAGNEIKAQGGCIIQDGSTFHWIGPEFESGNYNFHAINHYTSNDLQNWTKQAVLLTPDMSGMSSIPVYPTTWVGRPWVMKHGVGDYVMWVELGKLSGSAFRNRIGVFHAAAIAGPWAFDTVYVSLPDGAGTQYGIGDLGAFHDIARGNAYLLYTFDKSEPNGFQAIVKLSSNFLRVLTPEQGGVIAEFPKPGSNCREAAAMFKRGSLYYYIMSETRGWRPSATWYRTSDTIGPASSWSTLRQVALKPAGNTYSFRTQHDFVLPVTGSSITTYIYCGDRWSVYDTTDYSGAIGRQAWFPLTFDESGAPTINAPRFSANGGDWYLDMATGKWDSSALSSVSLTPRSTQKEEMTVDSPGKRSFSMYYSLPARALVTISIVTLNGSLVRILEQGIKEPGGYIIRWNGKDEISAPIHSGLYLFIVMAGAERVLSKPVVVQ